MIIKVFDLDGKLKHTWHIADRDYIQISQEPWITKSTEGKNQ